jgi:hypothetical protein
MKCSVMKVSEFVLYLYEAEVGICGLGWKSNIVVCGVRLSIVSGEGENTSEGDRQKWCYVGGIASTVKDDWFARCYPLRSNLVAKRQGH